jgi:uncharacterized membrane protein
MKQLGKEMMKASDDKIKQVAIHLYKAYMLSNIIKIGAFALANTLTDKQITDMIKAQLALLEKYGLEFSLNSDLTPSGMNAMIKSHGSGSSVASLDDVISSPTKARKAPATRKKAPTKAKKRAPATQKKTSAKKIVRKSASQKLEDCKKKYTVPELKGMAKALKVAGFSKMTKEELCKAIKYQ